MDRLDDIRYALHMFLSGFRTRLSLRIRPGNLIEDCAYRILLVTHIDYTRDELKGIDIASGIEYSCSVTHCGPKKVSLAHALHVMSLIPIELRASRQNEIEVFFWQGHEDLNNTKQTFEDTEKQYAEFASKWR